jgi:hypothetical protein
MEMVTDEAPIGTVSTKLEVLSPGVGELETPAVPIKTAPRSVHVFENRKMRQKRAILELHSDARPKWQETVSQAEEGTTAVLPLFFSP